MTKLFCAALAAVALIAAVPRANAQDKAAGNSFKVNVHYTGSGTVDDKHKILVFLFDSPEFIHGQGMPFTNQGVSSKDGSVTFSNVAQSPVYVSAVYDPSGNYDGQSGPPPTGASLGLYAKTPGEPAPVTLEAGKTVEIGLSFDDSYKMQ